AYTQGSDRHGPVRREDWCYRPRPTAGSDYPAFTRVAEHPDLARGEGGGPAIEPGVLLEGEQGLLDAQAEAAGAEFYSLGGLVHSPDHSLLAYAVANTHDERITSCVKTPATGQ